jgi:hypothetical protein
MALKIELPLGPMFHAGGNGFDADRFLTIDSAVPWEKRKTRAKHHEPGYDAIGYSPPGYFSVRTDEQAEMAIHFLENSTAILRRLNHENVPMSVSLQKMTGPETGIVDMIVMPTDLVTICAMWNISLTAIVYFSGPYHSQFLGIGGDVEPGPSKAS